MKTSVKNQQMDSSDGKYKKYRDHTHCHRNYTKYYPSNIVVIHWVTQATSRFDSGNFNFQENM